MDEERNPPSPLFEPKCKKISPKFIFTGLRWLDPFTYLSHLDLLYINSLVFIVNTL